MIWLRKEEAFSSRQEQGSSGRGCYGTYQLKELRNFISCIASSVLHGTRGELFLARVFVVLVPDTFKGGVFYHGSVL